MPPLTRKPPAKAPSKKGAKGARTSAYTAEEREHAEDLLGECEELIRSIAEARWPFYRPLREVLALVRAMPESQAFIDDPTKIIPGYAKAITKPMWLKQMQQKIAAAEYGSVEEFAVDMRLVFDNCYQRNGLASLYSEQAKMLELRFEDLVIERLGYPAISDADVMAALSQNRAVAQTKIPPHIEFYQKELKKDGRLQFTPHVLRSATRRRVLAALGTPLPKLHASSVTTTAKSTVVHAVPPPRPSPATTAPPAAAPPSLLSAAAKALHVAPATAPTKAPVKVPAPAAALAASSSGSLSKVPVPALMKTAVPPGVKMPTAALPGSKIPAAAPTVRAASGTPPPTATTATNPAANLDIAAAYQKREMPGHAFKQLEPSPLVRYGDESVKPHHHHGGHGDDNGESSSGSDTTSSSGSSSDASSSSNSGPASAVDTSSASADSAFARVMEDDDALHIGQPSVPLQQPAALIPPVANPPVPAPRAMLPTTTDATHRDVAAGKRARSPDGGTPTNVNGQRGANGHGAPPPMPQDDSSDDEAFAKVMASHADGFQSAGGIMPTSGSGVGGNGGSDEDSGDGLTLQHNRHDAKDFIAPDSVSPFDGMDHGFSASPADPDDDALLLGD